MINGIINVYKEKGYTSHDVVAKLRGILKQKKIGHTGTLDPDAEGVLPVCLGKGTKLCSLLTDKHKTYEAVLHLGVKTDTQDQSGTVLEEKPVCCTPEEVQACIQSFLGEQMQVPPMYSALKVQGKKLCELAREGIEIERKPRPVTFYEIQVQNISLPYITFSVTCSKGTYIRTLCHDIGEKLGCGGCMERLLRTRVDQFSISDSLQLSEIENLVKEGTILEHIVTVEELFSHLPVYEAEPELDKLLENGNPVPNRKQQIFQKVRMYTSTHVFVGIYEYQGEKHQYKPERIFCTPEDFRHNKEKL